MFWSQFIIALVGGTLGAALTQLATFLRDVQNKKVEGRFMALMLALALEDYASKCTEPYHDLSNYRNSNGRTDMPTGKLPKLPEYPEKLDWRSIDVGYTADIMQFRVRVDSAHGFLLSSSEIDHEDAWAQASKKGVELGGAALQIAMKLRTDFKLPPKIKEAYFDIDQFFVEKSEEIRKSHAILAPE